MKKIISVFAAAAMLMASAANVFALGYGEEWGPSGSSTTTVPVVTETAPPAVTDTVLTAPAVAGTYKDVPSTHWAYNAVERCSATKWFSGYPDGTFRPDGEITRAEAMKVFVTFMGEPLPENLTSTSYYDVKISDWFASYIEAGKDLFPKRTSMDSQQKFQPNMPVTREDTVYALVNALNYDQLVPNADQSVLNMFADQNSISGICKAHMAVAVSNGLVSGYSDGTIGAQDPLTRAQFATLLYRATFVGPLPETEKKLVNIEVVPDTLKEITVGESFEITATATYSDGSTEDYTSKLNPYTDSVEGIVNINKNKVTGVDAGTVLINYNNEEIADKNLVVVVKPNPEEEEPEPTATPEPTPSVDPEKAGFVTGTVDKEDAPVQSLSRYTVLVMDVSGSMYGTKISTAKTAATNFCKTVLSSGGDDNIALVAYDDKASVLCEFTSDLSTLESKINSMYANGLTNIYDGFEKADSLLDGVTDSDVLAKSVVFMTDGYPCEGPTSVSGRYNSSQWAYYEYANPIYDASQELIAKGYDIYTIGFFESSAEETLFANTFMSDIQNKGYFKANDMDALYDAFDKIAVNIVVSGVNVELKKDGEIVDSCSTTEGACSFKFSANPGTYTLSVSAPGYKTEEQTIEIKSGETVTIEDVCLEIE